MKPGSSSYYGSTNELRQMPAASLNILKKVLKELQEHPDLDRILHSKVADALEFKRELLENDLRRIQYKILEIKGDDP